MVVVCGKADRGLTGLGSGVNYVVGCNPKPLDKLDTLECLRHPIHD